MQRRVPRFLGWVVARRFGCRIPDRHLSLKGRCVRVSITSDSLDLSRTCQIVNHQRLLDPISIRRATILSEINVMVMSLRFHYSILLLKWSIEKETPWSAPGGHSICN